MDTLIFPGIFGAAVRAFFTRKEVGVDAEKISRLLSVRKGSLYLPQQKHTDRVYLLDGDFSPVVADAVVTRQRGVLIGVQVADCVPVLLHDTKHTVIGVVHAGWRGTAAQIVQKTIAVMVTQCGSLQENVVMALGPSIRGSCYEVGAEVKEAVYRATGEGEYYVRRGEKYFIDLASVNMLQAMSAGIPAKNIWISGDCTHCNPEHYYSFRFSGECNGSQGGFIGIF
ncbi:MAG: peptidoglycan editing factor PgeF [Nitrospirota bacterium]